jgi:hypothetical protein
MSHVACTVARSSGRNRMLKFAQLRSKAEIFAEITRNYPWVSDMRGGWEIEKFDFKPPSDSWMDAFKPLATFELELKSMPQFDKFDVWISGTTPKGDTKRTTVGTIAKQMELSGAHARGPCIPSAQPDHALPRGQHRSPAGVWLGATHERDLR